MKTPTQPTLMQLRQSHQLTFQLVADLAGVPPRVIYLLEIGGLVRKHEACKVIEALSLLTATSYIPESFHLKEVREGWLSTATSPLPKEHDALYKQTGKVSDDVL